MKVTVDMSELSDLGQELMQSAPKQAAAAVHKVTIAEGRQVKSRAKSNAPRDRPWLATSGIRMKTWRNPDGSAANIYSPPDPEGRNVALYVVFGTSRMPPQDFFTPALTPSEASYPAAVLAAVDPFSKGSSGPPESGDE